WLAVVVAAMILRPPLLTDETRYLAVAWEMWRDGQFLVPQLNGATYSHKPPLLFWLMNVGWAIFGVNDITARLVAPLFGLGTVVLTARVARLLWPQMPAAARIAPMVLIGGLFFALFVTLTMFDMILAFFAVAALLGLLNAARGRLASGMILCGIAIGFGILAKGPAILLHILPAALTAPWWAGMLPDAHPPAWKRWYVGVLGAVLIGAAIGLAWAIPAAIAGGPDFAHAIFVGQSAGRMVESFAHKRPFWWLAAWLPVLLLPWTAWPVLWKVATRGRRSLVTDGGLRLILVWFGAAFIAFSLISGKQLHYLLPEFPALALIAGRLLAALSEDSLFAKRAGLFPALLLLVLAGFFVLAPMLPLAEKILREVHGEEPLWMLLPAAFAAIVAWAAASGRLATPEKSTAALAFAVALLVVGLHLAARPVLARSHELQAVGQRLRAWQNEGEAIAHVAKYHGQFHFAGRLQKPITVIGLNSVDTAAWLAANPKGKIVSYRENPPGPGEPTPQFAAPYRNDWVVVWDREDLVRHPRAVYRN
ncbi:MAG: glycosyltransferase family 39 protein, partial [Alphaproteobacteria bacterium]|nr:glycosyltransferase family 39 protein [Alphaproteobacteria bacterium]